MSEQLSKRVWVTAAGIMLVGAAIAARWGAHVATGLFIGGAWNLASLWCLVHLLSAWIGPHPSRRRAIAWLLLKFPLLYLLAFVMFRSPRVSLIGFGVGFTIVLIVLIGWFALQARQMTLMRPHGR